MSSKVREAKFSYTFEQEVIEKLNRILSTLALVVERLDSMEERLSKIEEKSKSREKNKRKSGYKVVVNQKTGEKRAKGKNALEIMHRQGIIFESDLRNIQNKEKFIEYLKSNGIIVIEGSRERVLVTKEYLESFLSILKECKGPGEAEEKLRDEKQIRLYRLLRDSGLLTYDSRGGWMLYT
ncbi:MAG: hypothetical protein QXV28_07855 [Ignisphaera sp.]